MIKQKYNKDEELKINTSLEEQTGPVFISDLEKKEIIKKATLIRRFLSFLVDFSILYIVVEIITKTLLLGFNFGESSFIGYSQVLKFIVYRISQLVFMLLFFLVLPYFFNNQTIGMTIFGINISRKDNTKISINEIFLNYFVFIGLFYSYTLFLYFESIQSFIVAISKVNFQDYLGASLDLSLRILSQSFLPVIFPLILVTNLIIFKKEKSFLHDKILNLKLTQIKIVETEVKKEIKNNYEFNK